MSSMRRILAPVLAVALLPSVARADDAITGSWLLDEATPPFKSGSLAVSETEGGLRFDARLATDSGSSPIAGTAAKGPGPWEVRVARTPGMDSVLAGEGPSLPDAYRFTMVGARLAASWTDAQGKPGAAIFRPEKPRARDRIILEPLPAGVTEERSAPFVDGAGHLRGTSVVRNAQGSEVRVFRTDGAVTQVLISAGSRQISLLDGGELAVIDWVFDKVSFNHCRFFGFPGPDPTRVAFDDGGNPRITFANGDHMVRDAKTLDLVPEQSDFVESKKNETYQNGTRALPGIHYAGHRAVIQVVWWEYPPSGGTFDLMVGRDVVGHLPASALYRRVETGGGGYDVVRRFTDLGAALEKALAGKTDPGSRRFLAAMTD
jgi:hypothetical protein